MAPLNQSPVMRPGRKRHGSVVRKLIRSPPSVIGSGIMEDVKNFAKDYPIRSSRNSKPKYKGDKSPIIVTRESISKKRERSSNRRPILTRSLKETISDFLTEAIKNPTRYVASGQTVGGAEVSEMVLKTALLDELKLLGPIDMVDVNRWLKNSHFALLLQNLLKNQKSAGTRSSEPKAQSSGGASRGSKTAMSKAPVPGLLVNQELNNPSPQLMVSTDTSESTGVTVQRTAVEASRDQEKPGPSSRMKTTASIPTQKSGKLAIGQLDVSAKETSSNAELHDGTARASAGDSSVAIISSIVPEEMETIDIESDDEQEFQKITFVPFLQSNDSQTQGVTTVIDANSFAQGGGNSDNQPGGREFGERQEDEQQRGPDIDAPMQPEVIEFLCGVRDRIRSLALFYEDSVLNHGIFHPSLQVFVHLLNSFISFTDVYMTPQDQDAQNFQDQDAQNFQDQDAQNFQDPNQPPNA